MHARRLRMALAHATFWDGFWTTLCLGVALFLIFPFGYYLDVFHQTNTAAVLTIAVVFNFANTAWFAYSRMHHLLEKYAPSGSAF